MNEPFYLTDDQRMLRHLARKIARERVAPNAARYDEAEAYPEDSIRALIESGLYGIWVPEAYGGNAMGALALALVCEEIAAACAATGTQYLDQPLGGIRSSSPAPTSRRSASCRGSRPANCCARIRS